MRIFVLTLAGIGLFTAPAHAQYSGNSGQEIYDEVFGESSPQATAGIENIPVSLTIEDPRTFPDLNGKYLVLTALAGDDNAGPDDPLDVIGETRILLTGLNPQLNLVVAAPRQVTQDLSHALLYAYVEDMEGELFYISDDERFDGTAPARLTLLPPDMQEESFGEMSPDYQPDNQTADDRPVEPRHGSDTIPPAERPAIRGQAQFNAAKGLPRGSELIVYLTRSPMSQSLGDPLGRTVISLDGKSGYIDFEVLAQPGTDPVTSARGPYIHALIKTPDNRVFFQSGFQPIEGDFTPIRLSPTPSY